MPLEGGIPHGAGTMAPGAPHPGFAIFLSKPGPFVALNRRNYFHRN